MKGDWLYTLRERFTSDDSKAWSRYLAFSRFDHLTELITLDSMMCPDLIESLSPDDWEQNVQEDYRTTLFYHGEYLENRQPIDPLHQQVLAVCERPNGTEKLPASYMLCGYDLMDECFDNSPLTNCGPMPEMFSPSIVNPYGLLPELTLANEIRDKMRRLQPNDPHLGSCEVWAIARVEASA
ncbi:hypothetical protein Pla108_07740 [Botrimarina colliarenosi]|uniref:Uncharacterized protein n=1 Tax=Botrimarina colliarenosi TaxID=2528001 RepID=A0A5C6ALC7_9BACT|nr:hypothetical protein [Botrimarina colliarenosi]TWT99831.1 hypothetical protein Pla108_07740 [Botrimarina colliarenosi]